MVAVVCMAFIPSIQLAISSIWALDVILKSQLVYVLFGEYNGFINPPNIAQGDVHVAWVSSP